MRDHDVADLEPLHLGADRDHLAERAVARVDLAAARFGDVHRVGERGVIDVVLGRRGEDAQLDVLGAERAQRHFVEPDHARDVELGEVVVDALSLGGDRVGVDRVGSGHRVHPVGERSVVVARAEGLWL